MPNQSTIMDINSVISLGHTPEQPLMWSSSELTDGFEPHDMIYSGYMTRAAADMPGQPRVRGGGVPRVVQAGWYREGAIPGTTQPSDFEAYLMNY